MIAKFTFSILFLGSLAFGVHSTAARSDLEIVQAITLLQNGEAQKAYAMLERGFRMSNNTEAKAKMALMLALADDAKLIRPKRFYADYSLKNYSSLDAKKTIRLMTIIGDSSADAKDTEGARKAYQFVLASPEASTQEKEWATWRLGQIYLQTKGPLRAFRFWQNWLEQDRGGELKLLMLEGAGKAYMEALTEQKGMPLRLRLNSDMEQKAFFEGLTHGFSAKHLDRREARILLLNATRNHPSYASLVLYLQSLELGQGKKLHQAEQSAAMGIWGEKKQAALLHGVLPDFAKSELMSFEERLLQPKKPEAKSTKDNRQKL